MEQRPFSDRYFFLTVPLLSSRFLKSCPAQMVLWHAMLGFSGGKHGGCTGLLCCTLAGAVSLLR